MAITPESEKLREEREKLSLEAQKLLNKARELSAKILEIEEPNWAARGRARAEDKSSRKKGDNVDVQPARAAVKKG
jgi:hypothetical protein